MAERAPTCSPPTAAPPAAALVAAVGAAEALLLTLWSTWPLPLGLDAWVLGSGHMDQRGHVWATWNAAQSWAWARHSPLNFWPEGLDLLVVHGGHLDLLYGALLMRILGVSALTAHNLAQATWLGLATAGGYTLGWTLTRRLPAALVAGASLGLSPYLARMAGQGLTEELALGFVAWAAAAAYTCARRPGARGPVALAAAVVATTLASWEYGMFLALTMAWLGLTLPWGADTWWGAVRRLTAGCLAASALLLPYVLLFLGATQAGRAGLAAQLPEAAASPATEALVRSQSLSPDGIFGVANTGPKLLLGAGLLALLALLPGRARGPGLREAAPWLTLGLLFAALAMGPGWSWDGQPVDMQGRPTPFSLARAALPFLDWFYWPSRFVAVVAVAVAALAALGVARTGRAAWAVAAVGVALMAGQSWAPGPMRSEPIELRPLPPLPPPYHCLDEAPWGALLVVPFPSYGVPTLGGEAESPERHGLDLALNNAAHTARWWQTLHGRPLLTGADTPHAVPPAWRARAAASPVLGPLAALSTGPNAIPSPAEPAAGVEELRGLGVVGVVLHGAFLERVEVRDALRGWLEALLGEPSCESMEARTTLWLLGAPDSPFELPRTRRDPEPRRLPSPDAPPDRPRGPRGAPLAPGRLPATDGAR